MIPGMITFMNGQRVFKPSALGASNVALSRRQVLEAFGAIAATAACSSSEQSAPPPNGVAGSAGSGLTGGSGSGGGAGTAVGGAGAGGAGTGGSVAGSSGSGVNGGAGSGVGGGAGEAQAAGSGGTGTAGAPPQAGAAGEGGLANGGAGTGGATNDAGTAGASAGSGGGGGGGGLTAPPFDDVPMCTASRTDAAGQGPFFIHEQESGEDVSLVRQDIRGRYNESAPPGVEMQLHLRVLDSTSTDCNGTPVANVDVYIWHTDAQGYYSGFGTRGTANEQKPDVMYMGRPSQTDLDTTERFCRGVQRTNADGVVSFRSIFPGWYNGRDVHIHVVVLKPDSASRGRVSYSKQNSENQWIFTTQFYFEPEFTASVHENYEPYAARTTGTLATAYQGAIQADEANNSGLRATATLAQDIVTAQMQIVLNPA